MNLGERIREKRKLLGLTQAQVGAYFEISSVSVSEWERGISKPEQTKLESLARLLKTSISYLLTGRETQYVDHIQATVSDSPLENLEYISKAEHEALRGRMQGQNRPDLGKRIVNAQIPSRPRSHDPDSVFGKVRTELSKFDANFDLALEIQGFETRFNYVSDRLIALFMERSSVINPVPGRPYTKADSIGPLLTSHVPARLWSLAVAKKYLENMGVEGARVALIVAADLAGMPLRMAGRLQANAQLVGIDLVMATEIEQFSEYILSVEEGRPSKFDNEEYDHW